ncbi:1,3-beta-glucanosyltransferase gas1 [Tulasnella sp. 417]|nr:1,3-beta-glucanosyltransferase gas1 [Tulasnella sp. 417]
MKFSQAFAAVAALVTVGVSALPKITRTGRYLYQEDGTRFYVKGIAYQEQGTVSSNDPSGFPEPTDFIDPLSDPHGCNRDLPYLKQLGVNTIRVYSVNSAFNHDSCMQALSGAGIYVILDLALPVNGSIDRASPAWTTNLLDLYVGTIDEFSKYDNVLAYNVGNEVVIDPAGTIAGPFIKAAARDVKAYLKSKGSSALVSYSSTDGTDGAAGWRTPLANYLACDTDATSIDLYGFNNYRWCGDATIDKYSGVISDFQNFPIPAYFSEFGCKDSPPRLWTEVPALFGEQMVNEWSGGVAFSYFYTADGFGMVTISSDGSSVTTSDDFTRLQTQYNAVSFINSPTQSAAGSNTQATCPPKTQGFLAGTALPPTPANNVCDCLEKNALSCVFSNTKSNNTSPIIGELLNYACSQLGTLGGSCNPIGADGATGTYGPFSVCDPSTKLSYALSEYYELSNRQAAACVFGGNSTVLSTAPASAQAAGAAASSCASANPAGTHVPSDPTPTSPSTKGAASPGATQSGSISNGTKNNGAAGFVDARGALITVAASVIGLAGGILWRNTQQKRTISRDTILIFGIQRVYAIQMMWYSLAAAWLIARFCHLLVLLVHGTIKLLEDLQGHIANKRAQDTTTHREFIKCFPHLTPLTAARSNMQTTCPPKTDGFLASTALPPTPVKDVCECLQKNVFSCVFSNTSSKNTSPVIGQLLNYACSQIGTVDGTCLPIGTDGATGSTTSCLAARLLPRNATVISIAPSDIEAADAAAVACVSTFPTGTQVPTDPTATSPSTHGAASPGTTQNGNNGSKHNGATGVNDARGAVIAMAASVIGLAGGMFVLI